MILPWIAKLFLAGFGLVVSGLLVWVVCYVVFVLLQELIEEDDNVANK